MAFTLLCYVKHVTKIIRRNYEKMKRCYIVAWGYIGYIVGYMVCIYTCISIGHTKWTDKQYADYSGSSVHGL